MKPGDGSAREQAASCQKVLGGWANIANEYATKRYRSNLINWGMLPFVIPEGALPFQNLDYLFLPDIRKAVEEKQSEITAYVVKGSELKEFKLGLGAMTDDERDYLKRLSDQLLSRISPFGGNRIRENRQCQGLHCLCFYNRVCCN